MQTFLPYPDFARSAACLDRQRLGKQRLECVQILRAIREGGGWANHPATKMWRGYEYWLEAYLQAIIDEWVSRGYKNNIPRPTVNLLCLADMPPWLKNDRFHSAHRAALLFKNPEWYGQFNWTEEPKLEYWWPV